MGDEEINELEQAKIELISIKQSSLISLGYKEKKAKKLNSLPVLDALIEEYKERKENKLKKDKDDTKKNGFAQNMPEQFGTNPDLLIDEKPTIRGNKLWNLKPSSAEGEHTIYNKDAATRVHRIHNAAYPEGFVF